MKKKYTFRKFVNDLHLWLGLPSAVVLFVVCLTGTLYVFQKEITEWVDADQYRIHLSDNAEILPVARLRQIVESEKKGKVSAIEIPQSPDEAWTFTIVPDAGKKAGKGLKEKKPGKAPSKKEKTKSYWVDPFSGEIKGDAKTPTSEFFAAVLRLHRWLLIENHDIGGAITGTAAILMLFLQLTGLILWVPAKLKSWKKWNSWKNGFSVKTDARFKRFNFDLHKALGFYAFALITIMAITGPYFAFKWYKTGFAAALGTKPADNQNKEVSVYPGAPAFPISVEKIIQKVDSLYPYQGTVRINLPRDTTGSVAVLKSREGFFVSAGVDRLTLDQYSGRVLVKNKFADKSLGEKIVASAKYIHDGEIFGTSSKILYFLACLIATSLPVTGFLIWLGKGNKKASAQPGTGRPRRSGSGIQSVP